MRPQARPNPPRRRLHGDLHGVNDVLGNILIVGITVLVAGGLAGLVYVVMAPPHSFNAELAATLHDTDGLWGNGNEQIRVEHRGGQALDRSSTTAHIHLAGISTILKGSQLAGGFSDGRFTIGETWTHTTSIAPNEPVQVLFAVQTGQGGSKVVASSEMQAQGAACATDTLPPTVKTFDSDPDDVRSATVGPVTIHILVEDNCAGVNPAINPTLFFRLTDQPAFTNLGAMVRSGVAEWTRSIPAQDWTNKTGLSLEYYVSGMRDNAGNTAGVSPTQSDPIQGASVTLTYVNAFNAVRGTVTNFANAQSNSSAEATIAETSTSTTATNDVYTSTVVNADADVQAPERAQGAPNSQYAVIERNDKKFRLGYTGSPGLSSTIQSVEMMFRGKYVPEPQRNPATELVELRWNLAGGSQSAVKTVTLTAADATTGFNITADKSGGWTWTDIQNLQLEVKSKTSHHQIDVWVDAAWFRVKATSNSGFGANVEMTFASVPAAVQQELALRYRIAGGETYRVEVWNGTAWNTRGSPLDSVSATPWTYRLASGEFLAGAPKIRFIDADPLKPTGHSLYLTYVRMESS